MITFSILVKTYNRKNKDNFSLVKRSLNSILNQTYQNYKLFLIGDRYDNQKDFDYYCSMFPKDKISFVNLPIAKERDDKTLTGHSLWYSAGVNSTKVGVKMMVDQGFIYYARLDDDDYWYPNHLQVLADGYKNSQNPHLYILTLYIKKVTKW